MSSGLPSSAPRVLMLVGKSTGGIGTHVADLSAHLRQLGASVVVATDDLTARTFDLGETVMVWPGRAAGLLGSATRILRLRRAIRSAEVIHAHGHQAGLLALLLGGHRSPAPPKLIVSLHNEAPASAGWRGRVFGAAERLVARRADLVTGASSDLVERAWAMGAGDARLADVTSPRVPGLLAVGDTEREADRAAVRAELGLPPDAPVILTISRIAPQKDLDTLVRAAAILAGPGDAPTPAWTWVVVGAGVADLQRRLESQAERRAVPVRFVGPVVDPGQWLLAADVFVLTSTWEARALVVQEAMAAGLPVVASDVGGLPDLLRRPEDGPVGTLVPVGDAAGFAHAVATLLADARTRQTCGSAGRDVARSWPDGTLSARRWWRWYIEPPIVS